MGEKQDFTTSIRINPKVWEDFKIYCIKKKVAMSEKLERLIKEEMRKGKNKLTGQAQANFSEAKALNMLDSHIPIKTNW